MNGLCQQCQVYYPMPEDFGQGVPYACPQCQQILVPFEEAAPEQAPESPESQASTEVPAFDFGEASPEVAPAPESGPPADSSLDASSLFEEVVEPEPADDSWANLLDGGTDSPAARASASVPPASAPGDEAKTPTKPVSPVLSDPATVLWFHPHPSVQVEKARARRHARDPLGPAAVTQPDERPTEPITAPPPAFSHKTPPPTLQANAPGGPPVVQSEKAKSEVKGARQPSESARGASSYVMKGAGAGQAREELPLDVIQHVGKATPQEAAPRPETKSGVRSAAVTSARPQSSSRGGWAAAAGVAVLLVGGGGWFVMGMPGLAASDTADLDVMRGGDPIEPAEPAPGGELVQDPTGPVEADAAQTPPPVEGAVEEPETAPEPQASTPRGEQVRPRVDPPAETKAVPEPQRERPPRVQETKAAPEPQGERPPRVQETKAAPEPQGERPPRVQETKAAPETTQPTTQQVRTTVTSPSTVEPAVAEPSPRDLAREHIRAGSRLLQERKAQEAIGEFEQAIALDGRSAQAHRGMGIAYATLGRAAEAARHYESYLRLNPGAADAEQVRAIIDAYYASQQ